MRMTVGRVGLGPADGGTLLRYLRRVESSEQEDVGGVGGWGFLCTDEAGGWEGYSLFNAVSTVHALLWENAVRRILAGVALPLEVKQRCSET